MMNPRIARLLLALPAFCVLVAGAGLTGCQNEKVEPEAVNAGSVFSGPSFMRGTIGSYCSLEGQGELAVSGYGIIVNLPGTGSREVPQAIRQKMINMVRRNNLMDQPGLGASISPEQFLRRTDNAIVRVRGLMPGGAVRNTNFDILVEALEGDNELTSLSGGLLITTSLSVGGANDQGVFTRTRAEGEGLIFTSPQVQGKRGIDDFNRIAVVAGGGRVVESRQMRLILNQPSYSLARAIEERVNEQYGYDPRVDRNPTANATSDVVVEINVPSRYATKTQDFVSLLAVTYLDSSPAAHQAVARRMLGELKKNPSPDLGRLCIEAFRAMGKTVLPYLRGRYNDQDTAVRWVCLESGAALQDSLAVPPLAELLSTSEKGLKIRAAEALAGFTSNRQAISIMSELVNDSELDVRVAAYEAMALVNNHPLIDVTEIYYEQGSVKYVVHRIPAAKEPLVYVTQDRTPRIVLFGYDVGLPPPMIARLWEGDLLIRVDVPPAPQTVEVFGKEVLVRVGKGETMMRVYYGPYAERIRRQDRSPEGQRQAREGMPVDATVGNLAILLGHKPSERRPQPGMNMPYAKVVKALYELHDKGHMPTEVVLNINPLVDLVSRYRQNTDTIERLETAISAPGTSGS